MPASNAKSNLSRPTNKKVFSRVSKYRRRDDARGAGFCCSSSFETNAPSTRESVGYAKSQSLPASVQASRILFIATTVIFLINGIHTHLQKTTTPHGLFLINCVSLFWLFRSLRPLLTEQIQIVNIPTLPVITISAISYLILDIMSLRSTLAVLLSVST